MNALLEIEALDLYYGDAQALSGVNVRAGASLQYRLNRTAQSETSLRVSADVRHVTLSQAAKTSLGAVAAPQLDTQRLEFALRRTHTQKATALRLTYGLAVGRQWQGGVEPESFVKLSAGVARPLSPTTLISLTLSGESRSKTAGAARGDEVLSASGGFLRALPGGGQVGGSLYASKYMTAAAGRGSDTLGVVVSYAPASSFGAVRWSMTVGAQAAQFDGYTLAGIPVPGGRRYTSGFAELELLFPQI